MGQSRALLNADILLQVFKTLVEEDLFNGRRTLAAAVLVSKTFHLPAVKVLWTEIPSIFPLLYLFSSFVKIEDEGALQRRGLGGHLGSGVRCHMFAVVGAIQEQERVRFRNYAKHVRSIVSNEALRVQRNFISPSTWTILSGNQPLLPALQEIRYITRTPDDFKFVCSLPSSLRRLIIRRVASSIGCGSEEEWRDGASALLRRTFSLFPHLTELTLSIGDIGGPPSFPSRASLSQLRTLILDRDVSNTTMNSMNILALMERLEELRVGVDFSEGKGRPLRHTTSSDFPQLKRLTIVEYGFKSAETLLMSYRFPSLASIAVWMIAGTKMAGWKSLCKVTSMRLPYLTELAWMLSEMDHYVSKGPYAPSELLHTLSPFVSMRQPLKKLTINLGELGVIFTEQLYIQLANMWPGLEEFTLMAMDDHDGMTEPNEKPSLHALAAFASKCPRLRHLSLFCIQAHQGVVAEVMRTDRPDNHPLRVLAIHMTIYEDIQACAGALDRLFPNVDIAASQRARTAMYTDPGSEEDEPPVASRRPPPRYPDSVLTARPPSRDRDLLLAIERCQMNRRRAG